jgi:hypothetical protein
MQENGEAIVRSASAEIVGKPVPVNAVSTEIVSPPITGIVSSPVEITEMPLCEAEGQSVVTAVGGIGWLESEAGPFARGGDLWNLWE